MDSHSPEDLNLENGDSSLKESRTGNFSLARKKSDLAVVSAGRRGLAGEFVGNLREVIFGTKLCVLLPAIPMAIIGDWYNLGRVSIAFDQIRFY